LTVEDWGSLTTALIRMKGAPSVPNLKTKTNEGQPLEKGESGKNVTPDACCHDSLFGRLTVRFAFFQRFEPQSGNKSDIGCRFRFDMNGIKGALDVNLGLERNRSKILKFCLSKSNRYKAGYQISLSILGEVSAVQGY
jgi:hypothetical protein